MEAKLSPVLLPVDASAIVPAPAPARFKELSEKLPAISSLDDQAVAPLNASVLVAALVGAVPPLQLTP